MNKHKRPLYGGIEAGGTKFVCGTGSGNGDLNSRIEISTTNPEQTIKEVLKFFSHQAKINKIEAIGIGSFGPIITDYNSLQFGTIINSPKVDWSGISLLNNIEKNLNIKSYIASDTDVAAIGEYHHGVGLNVKNLLYLTIGTGIGGSMLINGKPIHGLFNSEMGHIIIPCTQAPRLNACPYHPNCLENLASGKALELTYGIKAENIHNKIVWEQEALYIATGIINMVMINQPNKIVLGGSVLKTPHLMDKIRIQIKYLINGYIDLPNYNSYIVRCSSDSIGILGAIKLAALEN